MRTAALFVVALLLASCAGESETSTDAGSRDSGGAAEGDSGGAPGACARDDDCLAFETCVDGRCVIPDVPDAGTPDSSDMSDTSDQSDTGVTPDTNDAGSLDGPDLSDVSDMSDVSDLSDAADAGFDAGGTDGGTDAGQGTCPVGVTCVDSFPFGDDRDTSAEPPGTFSSYSCKPTVNEGGPEVIYRVTVPEAGFLSAAVYEESGVDVDVHILSELNQSKCIDRGNFHARADVEAGVHWVVIDTYVSGGTPQAGKFHVDIGFYVPSRGSCAMETGEMPRVGDGGNHLQMPATGPMVLEAHLVTQEESYRPASSTQHLTEHYALSQTETGFVMYREEVWAPLEGGSFYGAGIGDPSLFPVLHEGWYVNMYWTAAARPSRGTRMILKDPDSSHAVVVAAGYETGPGDLSNIGGTPEETHFFLRTGHESTLTLGIAADQTLPYGPRVCE
ncbi:MAG: hypothetical protein HY897_24510 [Deltaproteobacteria bacterium]|nr:hypothetical protein [Deltaproteobacteria bacterium]